MPEIEHKDKPSIAAPPVAQVSTQAEVTQQAKSVSSVLMDKNITQEQLEATVRSILLKQRAAQVEAAKPREPDWANITERQAMSQDVYIPVIDHEVADYMNISLKDPEYEVVWASQDQRRIGQLVAMGYEFLKDTDIHPDFKLPLLFDSEGRYVYSDVVAMKVHKRILYGRRRKALQISLDQLSNRNRPPRVRVKDSFNLTNPVPNSPFTGAELYSEIV